MTPVSQLTLDQAKAIKDANYSLNGVEYRECEIEGRINYLLLSPEEKDAVANFKPESEEDLVDALDFIDELIDEVKDDFERDLAKKIKERREELGLSFGELGRVTGLNKSTISRIESLETKNYSISTAKRLALALSIPFQDFVDASVCRVDELSIHLQLRKILKEKSDDSIEF